MDCALRVSSVKLLGRAVFGSSADGRLAVSRKVASNQRAGEIKPVPDRALYRKSKAERIPPLPS